MPKQELIEVPELPQFSPQTDFSNFETQCQCKQVKLAKEHYIIQSLFLFFFPLLCIILNGTIIAGCTTVFYLKQECQ